MLIQPTARVKHMHNKEETYILRLVVKQVKDDGKVKMIVKKANGYVVSVKETESKSPKK